MASVGIIQLLIPFLFLLIPIGLALLLNSRFQKKHPQRLPYRWGYFNAVLLALYAVFGLGASILAITGFIDGLGSVSSMLMIIMPALMGAFAWFLYKRNRWVWIVVIVLQAIGGIFSFLDLEIVPSAFYIFVLIYNIYYIKSRWEEMSLDDDTDATDYDKVFD